MIVMPKELPEDHFLLKMPNEREPNNGKIQAKSAVKRNDKTNADNWSPRPRDVTNASLCRLRCIEVLHKP